MSILSEINTKPHRASGLLRALCTLALISISGGAIAQETQRKEPTDEEKSLASALFDQGKAMMGESRYSEACPKLVESYRLDPGGGTLLNVALCHAREGKHATAWAEFREAQAIAVRDGRQDRIDAAETEIQKLKPLLSYLTINVAPADTAPGLVVSIDGAAISKAAWGTPFPVDPGRHIVIGVAPDYAPYETAVDVAATSETKVVAIPKLAKKWATATPNRQGSGDKTGSGPLRTVGYISLGVGGAGIVVGSIFGAMAISTIGKANKTCPDINCPDAEAVEQSHDAKTYATVSNIGFGVGIAGAAAGLILLLRSPSSAPQPKASALNISMIPSREGGGVSVSGSF